MVAETVLPPKTFRKRHGPKKVFSIPVGKLRSNIASPGRSGSSSRSGCRSTCHHKVLLRNNRELARALSHEKERFRGMVTEHVNLKARLHETRLEVHGLERQLFESRHSLIVYQNSIRSHIRDAVRHSVSLAESLKLAMELCIEGPQDSPNPRSIPSVASISASMPQPQTNWVNPMVSGHTIRNPTISLRRVVMHGENNISNRIVAPREESSTETIEDISQSLEETQRPGGLSTCLEEDEDCNGDNNMIESDGEERDDSEDEDDSIRRKVVSFRSTTVEKEKNNSGLEAGKNSPLNGTITQIVESSIIERVSAHICSVPNNSKQSCVLDKPCNAEVLSRTPVVALNDISKFLQDSNSINVQKVISDIDSSKSSDRVLEESANEKENCPKSASRNKSTVKQKSISPGMEMHLMKRTSEICVEGSIERSNFSGSVKRDTMINDAAMSAANVPAIEEDPLEGTSWMHLNLFSEKKTRYRKGNSTKVSKRAYSKASESNRLKGNGSKSVNSSKEKTSECVVTAHQSLPNQAQEDSEILMNSQAVAVDEYNISDFDIGLKNCPIAQSTPLNHGKPAQDTDTSGASGVSKCTSKSNKDISFSNSDGVSDEIISQGKSKPKEGEKNLVVPPVDVKLDGKAFVTVRVKRLNLPDISLINSVANNHTQIHNCVSVLGDEMVDFLGFGANPEVEEKITAMKEIMARGKGYDSKDSYGSCSTVGSVPTEWSASITRDSRCFVEGESYERTERVRVRRKAAPVNLKEPVLHKKLRRE